MQPLQHHGTGPLPVACGIASGVASAEGYMILNYDHKETKKNGRLKSFEVGDSLKRRVVNTPRFSGQTGPLQKGIL